jgi:plasmid stability protein
MPDLTITDMPQDEIDALARRAERHGRSTEEEARHLLHEAAAEEMLVEELEHATAVAEAKLEAATRTPVTTPAGRRRVRYEPTPRRPAVKG